MVGRGVRISDNEIPPNLELLYFGLHLIMAPILTELIMCGTPWDRAPEQTIGPILVLKKYFPRKNEIFF